MAPSESARRSASASPPIEAVGEISSVSPIGFAVTNTGASVGVGVAMAGAAAGTPVTPLAADCA
ncbi:hypothetical protein [Burkholderia gladioli]|uniref:hypothetical protein n=1 Tax=Burkholderia gladioli TaxID=28095 RepID=UPI0038BD0E46